MSQHVHVRVVRPVGVSEDGELVETSACHCGASWTRTFGTRDDDAE